jgi:hypothetical protein
MAVNVLTSSLGDLGKFLTSATTDPNAPASVKTALADVTTAVHSVEAALGDAIDLLVDTEINALISSIPGLNLAQSEIDALANSIVSAVLALVYPKLGMALPAADPGVTAAMSNAQP